MPKIETVYARLKLRSHSDLFELNERPTEINERLYEVLNDDFYQKKLTETVEKAHPVELAAWRKYRTDYKAPESSTINAVAKFSIFHQKVDLLDIAFY